MNGSLKFLAIETSCDETAISMGVGHASDGEVKVEIIADMVRSQVDKHKEYGGVYPNLARLEHIKNLPTILGILKNEMIKTECGRAWFMTPEKRERAFSGINTAFGDERFEKVLESLEGKDFIPEVDVIYVTSGPGLAPSLWTGLNFAKALSAITGARLFPVNHMAGHFYSPFIRNGIGRFDLNRAEPRIALLVSGGHTEIIYSPRPGKFSKLGKTLDDAIGEAFDKVARLLGLEYPGGPKISALAEKFRSSGKENEYKLPRPMIGSKNLDFSFSGIKTAVLRLVEKESPLSEEKKEMIAEEFETAVTDVLVKKTGTAIKENPASEFIIAGGVSANKYIVKRLSEEIVAEKGAQPKILVPEKSLCGDNSNMIALAGFIKDCQTGFSKDDDTQNIRADGNWSIEDF